MFLWNNQWDKKYNYWHIGRPLFGAMLGIVAFFLFVFIWLRGTLPRFRYDQLMHFGWKVLVPLALLNVLVTGAVALLLGWRAA